MLKSTISVKLKPTDPSQTTVAMLSEEDSPHMVSLDTLATVIFLSRTWSPGKNTIVVLEVKYSSASCAYLVSVVQWLLFQNSTVSHEVVLVNFNRSIWKQMAGSLQQGTVCCTQQTWYIHYWGLTDCKGGLVHLYFSF